MVGRSFKALEPGSTQTNGQKVNFFPDRQTDRPTERQKNRQAV